MELPIENDAKVANEWQPISALIWVGPSSRCINLMAEKTGRSGQPVQKAGGGGGEGPRCAAPFGLAGARAGALVREGVGTDAIRPRVLKECCQSFEQHVGRVFTCFGQRSFAKHTR